MHETAFVNEIISALRNKFNKEKVDGEVSVNVRLSPLSHVSKEGLRNSYQELSRSSGFEDVRLNIEPLKVLLICHDCKSSLFISTPTIKCPRCNSESISINFEKEFLIESIEINKKDGKFSKN
ncbi:MAG: hypothetical protein DRP74_02075 [Candidatus Omnitrophota bacterium]|nr:MAG: hypothetical protein DRP74_02075 [Candidatus Omnitrophota bacterium]